MRYPEKERKYPLRVKKKEESFFGSEGKGKYYPRILKGEKIESLGALMVKERRSGRPSALWLRVEKNKKDFISKGDPYRR